MGKALKDSVNPAFRSKYADLGSVMDACLPALNKHGIAVIQPIMSDDFGKFVKTILIHESGEQLECAVPLIVGKNDMQGLGSAITYGRRYGLMSMAGIAPEDDDGNAAVVSAKTPGAVQGEALENAWRDGVLDSLPPDATPRQKAEAFAKFFCADFKGKGQKALENRWSKYQATIEQIAQRHPDLGDQIVDAFETRKNEITEDSRAAERIAAQ
jgi:hypothetical protein